MECIIREWRLSDVGSLAQGLGDKRGKAGFQFEGVLRSNAFKNVKVLDMKMYALTISPTCS